MPLPTEIKQRLATLVDGIPFADTNIYRDGSRIVYNGREYKVRCYYEVNNEGKRFLTIQIFER